MERDQCISYSFQVVTKIIRDGTLEHQFEKKLESFAPCYPQSLLLADFKENHTLLNKYKKIPETRKLEYIHE
jgi:hypothetical protein